MSTPSSSGIASEVGADGTYPPRTGTCACSDAVAAQAARAARMRRTVVIWKR